MDPLAENYTKWSPYSYCFNNPIMFIDPDGMAPSGGDPHKDIEDHVGINEGYTISTDNDAKETTIYHTSAPQSDRDVDVSDGMASVSYTKTTTIIGSDGAVKSVSKNDITLDVSLDITNNTKKGAQYSVSGSEVSNESVTYADATTNSDFMNNYASNDPIVSSVSNLAGSLNRDALYSGGSGLPGRTGIDRVENSIGNIVAVGAAFAFKTGSKGRNYDAPGATYFKPDISSTTIMNIPASKVNAGASKLNALSKQIPIIIN